MCRSIEEGGRRCSRVGCRSAEELTDRRAKAAARQRRYAAKKRAEPETEPENPFADFVPEVVTLTAEQRAEEKARLADFFARKRRDPNATWDAAPVVDDVENPFRDWVTGQPIP